MKDIFQEEIEDDKEEDKDEIDENMSNSSFMKSVHSEESDMSFLKNDRGTSEMVRIFFYFNYNNNNAVLCLCRRTVDCCFKKWLKLL